MDHETHWSDGIEQSPCLEQAGEVVSLAESSGLKMGESILPEQNWVVLL